MTTLNSRLPFSKYSGCGNDFILIDARTCSQIPSEEEWIPRLCRRKTGIGADGVIFLEHSSAADWKMRIFNADGKEAEMCGNGIRCLLRFLEETSSSKSSCMIETKSGLLQGRYTETGIAVDMGRPSEIRWDIPLLISGREMTVHHIDTGVPHACLFIDKEEDWDVEKDGRTIRNHPVFQPRGVNVNFIRAIDDRTIRVRTYERGVEGETLACGTGAAASALAFAKQYGARGSVNVTTSSGETLKISFFLENGAFEKVLMEGPAVKVFEGNITIDLNKGNKIK